MAALVERDRAYLRRRGSIGLWYAFLGAPIAWGLELFVIYPAVPYACSHDAPVFLYVIGIVGLLLSLGAGLVGYSIWSDAGEELPGDHATRMDRSRLMAVVGMMASTLFSLIIIGQLVATAIIGPCIPLPRVRFTPDALVAPAPAPVLASNAERRP